MSQHDFNIANQTFPSFRADLNNALVAAATTSSGASAPTTPYPYQLWYDTATEKYKVRNAANSAWIDIFGLDASGNITIAADLSVDGGTIKLDGNYPTGTGNVALGDTALDDASLSGANNTAIGSNALTANTTGAENTSVGMQSLDANTTGGSNTGIGVNALTSNTTASDNTAVGRDSLQTNTTGAFNTAVGRSALNSNTTASENTAVGYQALTTNTTGAYNKAFGVQALRFNTTGGNNVAIGQQALYNNTTANYNTSVGYQAGIANTTGTGNTFIGLQTGYSNTTGSYNTFIGPAGPSGAAGSYITTGSKNTIVGAYNGNQGGLDIRTADHNNVLSDGDGNPRLWMTGSTGLYCTAFTSGAGNATVKLQTTTGQITYDTSSARYKENIRDSIYGLSDVLQMRSAQFEYKDSGATDVGLIAEELDLIIPELVRKDAENRPDGVSYDRMVSVLVKAIQEQQETITALTARIEALEAN